MTASPATLREVASRRWRLGRQFVVRVAGLPYDTVVALRCPEATRCASEILDLGTVLAEEAQRVSDVLHDLIGANDDADSRRRLLALRRQIFKSAMPADPDGALAAVGAVDPAAVAPVRDWLARRQRMTHLEQELTGLLDKEVVDSRAELWRLSGVPRLRAGMQIASPLLDEQLVAFAGRDGAPPPAKKLRRVERSVLSYLYRTACKTSPFSSFTGIGAGAFDAGAAQADITVPTRWRNHVRLNIVVLTRIAGAISADLGRRGDLPVVLSPGLRQDSDRVRYVRRWITTGDDSASVSIDSIRDGLFYLRRSGVLDGLTGLLRDGAAWRCGELAAWLRQQTGAGAARSEEYLSVLLQLGILQVDGFSVDVHTPEPLRHLREFLAALDRPWADDLAVRVGEAIDLVETFRSGGLAQRRSAVRQLRRQLHDILTQLGVDTPSLPQTLLYEDCAVDTALSAPDGPWRRLVSGDLGAVQQVLPAFDMTLPHRILFHGFFLTRYGQGGRCDDLLRLVEDFHEDLYDQYLMVTASERPQAEAGTVPAEENWLGQPELTTLDQVRTDFAGYVRAVAEAAPDAAEIRLDPAVLHGLGHDVAGVLDGYRSEAHFIQVARRQEGPLAVLNQSLGGLSFPFSRFTHCFDDNQPPLSTRLREQSATVTPPGAVFAEVTGGQATTNLNLHAQLTDYVVVCPGETSLVPEADQLTLDDLYLEHDIDSDRVVLRSTRLDREVVPVYLGYLIPMALPQLHRTLLLLSPASLTGVDVWRGVPAPADIGGVTMRPRVRVGDVVVSRQSWSTAPDVLPRRGDGMSDADWFLGWQRWWRANRLPAQVFATVHTGQSGRAPQKAKPQYVDRDSYLSLLALEAMLNSDVESVVFREMLPAGDELTAGSADGGHVAEFAIETFPISPSDRIPSSDLNPLPDPIPLSGPISLTDGDGDD